VKKSESDIAFEEVCKEHEDWVRKIALSEVGRAVLRFAVWTINLLWFTAITVTAVMLFMSGMITLSNTIASSSRFILLIMVVVLFLGLIKWMLCWPDSRWLKLITWDGKFPIFKGRNKESEEASNEK
jgi:hypothetical protein